LASVRTGFASTNVLTDFLKERKPNANYFVKEPGCYKFEALALLLSDTIVDTALVK